MVAREYGLHYVVLIRVSVRPLFRIDSPSSVIPLLTDEVADVGCSQSVFEFYYLLSGKLFGVYIIFAEFHMVSSCPDLTQFTEFENV